MVRSKLAPLVRLAAPFTVGVLMVCATWIACAEVARADSVLVVLDRGPEARKQGQPHTERAQRIARAFAAAGHDVRSYAIGARKNGEVGVAPYEPSADGVRSLEASVDSAFVSAVDPRHAIRFAINRRVEGRPIQVVLVGPYAPHRVRNTVEARSLTFALEQWNNTTLAASKLLAIGLDPLAYERLHPDHEKAPTGFVASAWLVLDATLSAIAPSPWSAFDGAPLQATGTARVDAIVVGTPPAGAPFSAAGDHPDDQAAVLEQDDNGTWPISLHRGRAHGRVATIAIRPKSENDNLACRAAASNVDRLGQAAR